MKIELIEKVDTAEVQNFILSQSNGMVYYSANYLKMIENETGCVIKYLVAIEDNKIIGILPLALKEGVFGTVINSLPYYGSHGGILTTDLEARKGLAEAYNKYIVSKGIASSTYIDNLFSTSNANEILHNYQDERIGQLTPINYNDNHADKLMDSFHYKTRNMVRKAEKQGLKIEIDNTAWDFLYKTHLENMEVISGKPKRESFFIFIKENFQSGTEYNIYTAKDENGILIAALLILNFNKIAEYFTPVVKEEHRSKQPLSLIIYEALKDYSKLGYNWWNWGGTWKSQEGVYRFKSRWGTKDFQYKYYTQLNNLEILKSSPEVLLKEYSDFFVIPFDLLKA